MPKAQSTRDNPDSTDGMRVWIGVAGVTARPACEILSPDEGAYINFLTLARNDASTAQNFLVRLATMALNCLN